MVFRPNNAQGGRGEWSKVGRKGVVRNSVQNQDNQSLGKTWVFSGCFL